jgi:type I restriction enzyme, S subunit
MKQVKLEQLFLYTKGKPPKPQPSARRQLPYLNPEYLRGNGAAELVDVTENLVTVKDRDLILLWDGSNSGEFFFARHGVLASTMVLLNFDDKRINRDYLYYHLKRIEPYLKAQTSGSGIPHVDKEVLGNIEILVHEIQEQKKIADVLNQIDEAISQTEALITKYERVRTGLMQDLLTKGVDEQGRIRSEATHTFKDSPLGRVPLEWDVKPISELCNDIFLGLTTKVEYVEQGGNYLIRAKDINAGELSFDEALQISKRQHQELTKYRMAKKGDVLVSKSGTLGICALVDTEVEFSIYESIIVLQPSKSKLESSFLLWLMRDRSTQERMLGEKVGSTVGHLNLLDFRKLLVPVVPIEEQGRLLSPIEVLQKDIKLNLGYLAKLRTLKTGLMQDLLSGNKPVDALLEQVESKHLEVTA